MVENPGPSCYNRSNAAAEMRIFALAAAAKAKGD